MSDEIPKRPQNSVWNIEDLPMYQHEHAVAKALWEALEKTVTHAEYSPYFDNAMVDNGCQCAGHIAMRRVKASGWKYE